MVTAIAILALLLTLLFGMLDSASRLVDSAEKGGDSAIQAKQVLDRIGLDIAGMVNRSDVDQFYYQPGINTGNDKMFFYSEALGYAANTPATTNTVSLVGYRVENNSSLTPAQPVLQRLAYGLPLDGAVGTVMQFLTFPASTQTIPLTYAPTTIGTIPVTWPNVVGTTGDVDNGASPQYYDEISSETFRMEICFQDQSGKFSWTPPFVNNNPTATTIANPASAIIVAIAVLDSKSRQLISTPTAWTALQQALPDLSGGITNSASGQPVLMDTLWNSALMNPATIQSLKGAGVPVSVTAQVRVYQRYYPLNPPLAK